MKLLGKFIYNKTLDIPSKSAFYFAIRTTSEYNHNHYPKKIPCIFIKFFRFLINESLFPVGGCGCGLEGSPFTMKNSLAAVSI